MSYQFLYDNEDRLNGWVDADGRSVKFKLGKDENVTGFKTSSTRTNMEYDANGNVTSIHDGKGVVEYKYDAFNRLVEATYKYSPIKTVRFIYDPLWRIREIDILNELEEIEMWQRYEWDILGNIRRIEDPDGEILFLRDPSKNQVIRELANGIKSTFTYNDTGELISIRHDDKFGHPIVFYKYMLDGLGNVIAIRQEYRNGVTVATGFEWDTRGYLKTLTLPDGTKKFFEFDHMGNRTKMIEPKGTTIYEYDNYNRLIKAGNDIFKYDRTGHLVSSIENGKRFNFKWNDFDQIVEIKTPKNVVKQFYEPSGNLISRIENKQTTHYLPNPIAPPGLTLAEFNDSGKITRSYIYGDGLLGFKDPNLGARYFLEDGFSSIRYITDSKGDIVGQQDFSPFAELTFQKGEFAGFRMAGERIDQSTGHLNILENNYHPLSGRYFNPATILMSGIPRPDATNQYTHACFVSPNPRCNQTRNFSPFIPPFLHNQEFLLKLKMLELEQRLQLMRYNEFINKLKISKTIINNQIPESIPPIINRQIYMNYRNNPPKGPKPGKPKPPKGPPPPKPPIWPDPPEWVPIPPPPWPPDWKPPEWPVPPDKKPPRWPPNLFKENYVNPNILHISNKIERKVSKNENLDLSEDDWRIIDQWERELERLNERGLGNTPRGRELEQILERLRERLGIKEPPKPPTNVGDKERQKPKKISFNEIPFKPLQQFQLGLNPLNLIQDDIGGVEINASARFIGLLGHITGLVYDKESDRFILVGDRSTKLPPIDLSYFVVAENLISQGYDFVQFSLDPADPKNPEGEWLKCVWNPEESVKGTTAGNVMFEADWLLKQYSFGTAFDENGKGIPRYSTVEGFKDYMTLSCENYNRNVRQGWNRFWIVIGDAIIKRDGDSFIIEDVDVKVLTEAQHVTKEGLKDIGGEKDWLAEKFAKFFEEHYDEFAREEPAFAQLKEWGKVFGLVKWLHENNIPINIDPQVLRDNYPDNITYVNQVHTLNDSKICDNPPPGYQSLTMFLFGGDEIRTNFREIPDNEEVSTLAQAMQKEIKSKPDVPVLKIDNETIGVVMPFTKAGNDLWKQVKSLDTIESDGLTYHLDQNRKVDYATDTTGSQVNFVRDGNGQLTGFNVKTTDGWSTNAKGTSDGTVMDISSPRGDTYSYRWENESFPSEMSINGQPYAKFSYDTASRTVNINYDDYSSSHTYDSKGNLADFTFTPTRHDKSGTTGNMRMNYDENGRLIGFQTDTGEDFETNYDGDILQSLRSADSEINYSYDNAGRLSSVSNGDASVNLSYDGESLQSVTAQKGDAVSKATFENDLLKEVSDSNGGNWSYRYDNQGMLTEVTDSVGAKAEYHYDKNGNLTEIVLPENGRIVYTYSQQSISEQKDNVSDEPARLASISFIPKGQKTLTHDLDRSTPVNPGLILAIVGFVIIGGLGAFALWLYRRP